jgi:hypothetical protein
MSTTTLAIGLGSGLALWYLTKGKPAPTPTQTTRNCASMTISPTGVTLDGARLDVGDAIRCCQAIGAAEVTVEPHAPAATYAAVMSGLQSAKVPTSLTEPRNARARGRKAGR